MTWWHLQFIAAYFSFKSLPFINFHKAKRQGLVPLLGFQSSMQGMKTYSLSEVTLHSTKESCWLSIHGKVYDVTSFLEDHPGGEDVILHASASGDATLAFDDVGHSSGAVSQMDSYVIGTLGNYVPGDEPSKPTSGPKRLPEEHPQPSYSFFDYFLPLLVLAIAFAAWYYLTFYSKTKA